MRIDGCRLPWATAVVVVASVLGQAVSRAGQAQQILEATGVRGGLVVHLGCGDGRLTAQLCANERYIVHGLDREAANVKTAREHIISLGLYGPVSADRLQGTSLPYAENMVNLVVAEQPLDVTMGELMRVLVPGGVAYLSSGGRWVKRTKPWPGDIDQWTHWLHDASGNAVAADSRVGPPRRIQWAGGPLWQRHHDTVPSTTAMVSADGRLFYISDEAPPCLDATVPDKWFLTARDAFNGVLLWKLPMGEWGWDQWSAEWKGRFNEPPHLPKRLVAVGRRVYVTLGFNAPLTALDAATGEVVREYPGTENTDEILYRDGLLVLSLNTEARRPSKEKSPPVKKSVCVLEAESGRILWKKGLYSGLRGKFNTAEPFGRLELTLGGEQVFLADEDAIVSLDIKTGQQRWRRPRPQIEEHLIMYGVRMSDMCVMVYADGVLLFAQPEMKKKRSWHTLPGTLYAFDAADGELLWRHTYGGWAHNWQPDVFAIDGTVWVHEHVPAEMRGHDVPDKSRVDYAVIGLDIRTGALKKRISTKQIFNVGHHHRCYRGKATQRYLLPSRRGVEFIDLSSGDNDLNHWARGACLHGIVPCNGLLYLSPHPCDCYIETKLNGYYALAPRAESTAGDSGAPVFEKGPAYGKALGGGAGRAGDWPTFRHDELRSGSTSTPVPAELHFLWRAAVGGRLSPPVVADGMLLVASVDRYEITALDAENGRQIWSFTAGGRVDTPPTIHEGLVLFGSADGWAYCLRAADGRLVWRRRAAPRQRLVGAYGRLESAWPVHGSILLKDDVAYLAAGRSSYLDGGIYLYALEPATGKVLQRQTIYSPDPRTDKMPPGGAKDLPGVLGDILVSDGSKVYLRQQEVFSGDPQTAGGPHLFSTAGFRDGSWFNRTKWLLGSLARAEMIVFNERVACGIQAFGGTARWAFFTPGAGGYRLFAVQGSGLPGRSSTDSPAGRTKARELWSVRVPVRANAMVLTRDLLFIAGAPDLVRRDDPLAAFEGRLGGRLLAVSVADGREMARYELASPPVLDGLIAAAGRLFLATEDGRVHCLGRE